VVAYDRILLLKTLRRVVRVVWVYRGSQWIALVSTDLGLTVEQIIEFYGARWRIEAGFREIKQEIGSSQSQTRNSFRGHQPSTILYDGYDFGPTFRTSMDRKG